MMTERNKDNFLSLKLVTFAIMFAFFFSLKGQEGSSGTDYYLNERSQSRTAIMKQTLRSTLNDLEKKYHVKFAINDNIIDKKYIDGPLTAYSTVEKTLNSILTPLQLTYKKVKGYYIILSVKEKNKFEPSNLTDYTPISAEELEIDPSKDQTAAVSIKSLSLSKKNTEQQSIAQGKVVSEKEGFPLPAVSVQVKGSASTVSTDINGNYQIPVPNAQAVLIFSYIGYLSQEVPLKGVLKADVQLKEDVKLLREVLITVPYGTQTRESFTGSAVTVTNKTISDRPRESFQSSLQGNVPGLQVMEPTGQPGAAPNVRIRGIGSTDAGNSSPLYVIDGVPVLAQGAAGLASSSNTMAGINPNDIETVTVLKDASATSIYGSLGANGVIMITTKSGAKGKTKIDATAQYGINQMSNSRRSTPLTTAEMSSLLIEGVINSEIAGLKSITTPEDAYAYLVSEGLDPDVNTNWFDIITQTGQYSQYNIAASGGDAKTNFFLSGGYYKRDAVTKGQDYDRKSGRLSLHHKATDKLSFGGRISLSRQEFSTIKAAGSGQNPMRSLYRLVPWLAPYNADGTYNANVTYNPELLRNENVYRTKISQLIGNTNMEYKITDYLSFESRVAIDYNFSDDFEFWSPLWVDGRGVNGRGMEYDLTWDNWSLNNLLKYKTQIKDFGVNATLGQEASKRNQKIVSSQATNYSAEGLYNLASASTPLVAYSAQNHSTLASYFLNTSFDYQRKYYLNATGRRDGSSRFGNNVKYGNFWSVGVAWNIHEENFMKALDYINQAKLRASYGQSGSQLGQYYGHLGYYTTTRYNGQPGFGMAQMESGDLSWEKNTPLDIGFEFAVLDNRLSGNIDWYTRTTSDLFMDMPVSHTNGVNDVIFNIGSMKNTGIEIALNSDNIRASTEGGFAWQTNFNISTQKNRVVKLVDENRIVESYYVREIGEDYYQFYLKGYAGVERTTGEPLWYTNGDRTATTTDIREASAFKQERKTGTAKFYGGLTNTFSYKGFNLSALIYFNVGGHIYDIWGQYSQTDGSAGLDSYGLMSRMLYDNHWKKPGDVAAYPKIVYRGLQSGLPGQHSTRFLYSGTYVRLRDVKLSYDFPLQKTNIKMSQAQLYLQANNLYTWIYDDLLPYDPEVGIGGLMNSNLPISRQFILGVSLTF